MSPGIRVTLDDVVVASVEENGQITRWRAQRSAGGGEDAELRQDAGSIEQELSSRKVQNIGF
jgi:hypothetical protein